ncbi:MAG: type II toxin-antitoxin system RelE/ParE family toxin [Steroidobacteraceae bacterium]|nr:type II toxin-antitoxin system RelE/ParE family toxin [Steroidobacteraceae bacterium]
MLRLRKLTAVLFRTASGREPVREWLRSLPPNERHAIGEDIAYVQYRWPIGRPHVDHLRDGIWEVRSRLENRIARVLFAVAGEEIVLLHGFIKKTRATPAEDLDLAARRWTEWKNEHEQTSRVLVR